jgi:hypothetical protein
MFSIVEIVIGAVLAGAVGLVWFIRSREPLD